MFDPRQIANALRNDISWVGDQALDLALCTALLSELDALDSIAALIPGGIGRAATYRQDHAVRGDRIAWLNSSTPSQRIFLKGLERLRITLNRELYLGLSSVEAHFARYGVGARYQRHLDSFVGAANRTVSLVAYLNPDWHPGDGGELVLYESGSERITATIEPRAGTIVAFLSEVVPHEVLPAGKPRASLAAWFRRR